MINLTTIEDALKATYAPVIELIEYTTKTLFLLNLILVVGKHNLGSLDFSFFLGWATVALFFTYYKSLFAQQIKLNKALDYLFAWAKLLAVVVVFFIIDLIIAFLRAA